MTWSARQASDESACRAAASGCLLAGEATAATRPSGDEHGPKKLVSMHAWLLGSWVAKQRATDRRRSERARRRMWPAGRVVRRQAVAHNQHQLLAQPQLGRA
jgi:hypothetical protein